MTIAEVILYNSSLRPLDLHGVNGFSRPLHVVILILPQFVAELTSAYGPFGGIEREGSWFCDVADRLREL